LTRCKLQHHRRTQPGYEFTRRQIPAELFETDRWRQNLLVLNGCFVLRFIWTMIEEQPEKIIAMVREAIKMLTADALRE
jgi:very-short-patch-repair endonuclease